MWIQNLDTEFPIESNKNNLFAERSKRQRQLLVRPNKVVQVVFFDLTYVSCQKSIYYFIAFPLLDSIFSKL